MKPYILVILLISLFTLSARAESCAALNEIPKCAIPCLTTAAKVIGCPTDDYSCMCKKATSPGTDTLFLNAAKPCVLSKCGFGTASKAQESMKKVCQKCVWGKDEV